MRRAYVVVLALTAFLWAPAPAQGQDDPFTCFQTAQDKSAPGLFRACGPQLLALLGDSVSPDALRGDLSAALDRLKQPETLNLALGKVEAGTPLKRVLQPLNLEFVNLQSDAQTVLGLRYGWTKDLRYARQGEGVNHWGYQVNARASGTVTAEASQNTENFIQSGGEVVFFSSRGGVLELEGDDLRDFLNDLEDQMASFDDYGALRASDAYQQFMGAVWDRLSTQTYLRFDGNLSYEADQLFDRTQTAYGAKLGVDIKGWRPSGPLADLNLFDWPAALLRVFTGYDEAFRPLGSTIPTLVVGLDQVEPGANPEREALDEMDTFTRVSLELAYRSPVAKLAQGPVFLEMGLRAYKELGASDAIKSAKLDSTRRFFAALTGPGGITASYASGRLPFDLQSTEVWGLGFRYSF
jgi:hypothetical protein